MIAAILFAAAAPPPPPIILMRPSVEGSAPSDASACKILGEIAAGVIAEAPKMIDAITRLDGAVVLCSAKVFQSSKFFTVPQSAFREGWRQRKQAQWNELNCGKELGVLVRRGWRISQALTWVSGERIVMDAECK